MPGCRALSLVADYIWGLAGLGILVQTPGSSVHLGLPAPSDEEDNWEEREPESGTT